MSIFEAVIQGIVQGLTEFLPISSSGHLLISQHVLGVQENNLFFNIMLHIGTLVAVLIVYYKKILDLIKAFFIMVKKIFCFKFKLKELSEDEQLVISIIIGLIPLFLLFVPIPGAGMNVKDVAKSLASEKNIILVGICLIITSILLRKGQKIKYCSTFDNIKYDEKHQQEICSGRKKVLFLDAIWIGITQLIAAIFPGISRSGSTLAIGLMRGINKESALDYSFIMGVPTIIAAALLETKEAVKENLFFNINLTPVFIGMIVSVIVGLISIYLFKLLLKTNKLSIFVIYTFLLGLGTIVIGVLEFNSGINIFTGHSI